MYHIDDYELLVQMQCILVQWSMHYLFQKYISNSIYLLELYRQWSISPQSSTCYSLYLV